MICLLCDFESDNIVEVNLHFRDNHPKIYFTTQKTIWSYVQ